MYEQKTNTRTTGYECIVRQFKSQIHQYDLSLFRIPEGNALVFKAYSLHRLHFQRDVLYHPLGQSQCSCKTTTQHILILH